MCPVGRAHLQAFVGKTQLANGPHGARDGGTVGAAKHGDHMTSALLWRALEQGRDG